MMQDDLYIKWTEMQCTVYLSIISIIMVCVYGTSVFKEDCAQPYSNNTGVSMLYLILLPSGLLGSELQLPIGEHYTASCCPLQEHWLLH